MKIILIFDTSELDAQYNDINQSSYSENTASLFEMMYYLGRAKWRKRVAGIV